MTAVPRDPSFWKRFSVAAHISEEQKSAYSLSSPSSSTRPSLKHQDSWLESQTRKHTRHKRLVWVYSISVVVAITAIVFLLVWLFRHGLFLHGEPVTFP